VDDLIYFFREVNVFEVMRKMTDWPFYVIFGNIYNVGCLLCKFSDFQVTVHEYLPNIGGPEIVIQIIVQYLQLLYLKSMFSVYGIEFLVKRLQFFISTLQFFIGRK